MKFKIDNHDINNSIRRKFVGKLVADFFDHFERRMTIEEIRACANLICEFCPSEDKVPM